MAGRAGPAEIRLATVAVSALLGMGAAIAIAPVAPPPAQTGVPGQHLHHVPRLHPR